MSLKLVETPEEIKDWIRNLSFVTKKAEIIEQRTFTIGKLGIFETPWLSPALKYKRETVLPFPSMPTHYEFVSNIRAKIEPPSYIINEKTLIFSSRVRKDVKFFNLQIESNTESYYDHKLLEQFVYCQ